jgi:hypothetical protein
MIKLILTQQFKEESFTCTVYCAYVKNGSKGVIYGNYSDFVVAWLELGEPNFTITPLENFKVRISLAPDLKGATSDLFMSQRGQHGQGGPT